MHAETMSRAAFELVSEAISEIDLYRQSRDRNHLLVARSKLDDALQRDRRYVNAVFYSGVVNDLIGHIGDAIQSFRAILAEGVEGAPVVLEQVRYNLAVSLYHRYSRKYLEEAEVEFLAVLETTEDPLLRCLARAGLAQTYAMWEIPPDPDARDAREERLLEDLFRKSLEFSDLTLAQLEDLEEIPEALRRQIRATADNARGMALMYYTDYRGEGRGKRLREALTRLRRADQHFPMDWANTCDLGSCHMRLGYWEGSDADFEECRKHLRQVVEELRPEYGFALYEIGRSYRIQGRFPEARQFLERARAIPKAERDVGDTRVNREIRLAESESTRYP
jgi:tetratricopeptide (TPR) repeat protein